MLLELVEGFSSREMVASFTYDNDDDDNDDEGNRRVGVLRVCKELGERIVPFEQVCCSCVALVERERRRMVEVDPRKRWP